jgi:hypothetical protein
MLARPGNAHIEARSKYRRRGSRLNWLSKPAVTVSADKNEFIASIRKKVDLNKVR